MSISNIFTPALRSVTYTYNRNEALKLFKCLPFRTLSNWQTDDYQLLHSSKIPTFHFQKSLPRLPIPKLEDTCEKYLASQRPLLKDEQYQKTESLITDFKSNYGQELQKRLISHDKKHKDTSYISKPWFEYYLKSRIPLVLNYNPFIAMKDDPKEAYNNQVVKASNIIIASLRFMKSLKKQVLNPDVFHLNPKKSDTSTFKTVTSMLPQALSWYGAFLFKAYPLDMSQYKNLFHTSRIPCKEEDTLYSNANSRHILVMRKGNIYIFDVLDKNGLILSPRDILSRVNMIVSKDDPPPEYAIGYLTSENRNTWAEVRDHILTLGNSEKIEMIDSALFCINLDYLESSDEVSMCENFLYGPGSNRWFDKSLSVIITPKGHTAINFEHSWGDGVAVLRYFNELFTDITENPKVHPNDLNDPGLVLENNVRKIDFVLDDKVRAAIKTAESAYKKLTSSLELNTFKYQKLGKSYIQKFGLGPDSVMQLGFQLAQYYLMGKTVATYESASTAAFKHGRTETVRPATSETKLFTETVSKHSKDYSQLKQMLKDCSTRHSALTKNGVLGKGFDRHLFALKYLAQQEGKSHAIYEDPAYSLINHNILSTSTLSSPVVAAGGFGAVVNDGFGIGYTIQDDMLGCVVTSYSAFNKTQDFLACLSKAFDDIYNVLENSK